MQDLLIYDLLLLPAYVLTQSIRDSSRPLYLQTVDSIICSPKSSESPKSLARYAS